jgi:hypothetical protein
MGKPYPHQNKEGVLIFDNAVKKFLGEYTVEKGYKLEKIQECQWAIWDDFICFKIYLPDGHNFPINETVSEKFSSEWFDASEIPLSIFYQHIGEPEKYKNKGLERYSLEEIPDRIRELTVYFTEIKDYFNNANREALWSQINRKRKDQLAV